MAFFSSLLICKTNNDLSANFREACGERRYTVHNVQYTRSERTYMDNYIYIVLQVLLLTVTIRNNGPFRDLLCWPVNVHEWYRFVCITVYVYSLTGLTRRVAVAACSSRCNV